MAGDNPKDLLIPCADSCPHHIVTLSHWNDDEVSLTVMLDTPGFWKRLREAWRYLWRSDRLAYSECIVAGDYLDEMAAFLLAARKRRKDGRA